MVSQTNLNFTLQYIACVLFFYCHFQTVSKAHSTPYAINAWDQTVGSWFRPANFI